MFYLYILFVICDCLEVSKYKNRSTHSPILVTELGIVMLVKPEQPQKQFSPKQVTV